MSALAAPPGITRLLSDERLTRRAVEGDERAFAAIFRRYHQALYRYCLAIVGNPEDAQDALQNTMMKVLRALPGEERRIELKPWLYRIAHNESIDLLRRRRESRELDVEQVAPGYGLAEDVATRERLRSLLADLRELPERQRQVLVMRELSGFDFEEIGAALATTSAVARQTLYEARQSLHQMETGREMDCDVVTRALSDGDGRVIRRRDVRAHLRSCTDCRLFGDEIAGRERALAALSPLPAVAAAGMLQGLLGGSQAATGGGLAAVLGGGAAKTVGASAAAKGVATVAVVAAMGVTAADRTGVIHLGLPGDGGAGSSKAAPESGQAPASGAGDGRDGDAEVAAKGGGDRGGRAGKPAGPETDGPSVGALPAGEGRQAPVAATPSELAAPPGKSQADAKTQGPPLEQVTGKGHEDSPSAAAHGQETAAEQLPPLPEPVAGAEKEKNKEKGRSEQPAQAPVAAPATPRGEKAPPPSSPAHGKAPPPSSPAHGKAPPSSPPASGKGPPPSPPAAKPESQPQPQPQPKAEAPAEPPASPAPASPGKGAEKSAEAGKKG